MDTKPLHGDGVSLTVARRRYQNMLGNELVGAHSYRRITAQSEP